jgi:hypothetical protein
VLSDGFFTFEFEVVFREEEGAQPWREIPVRPLRFNFRPNILPRFLNNVLQIREEGGKLGL